MQVYGIWYAALLMGAGALLTCLGGTQTFVAHARLQEAAEAPADPELEAFYDHQAQLPRPSKLVQARSILQTARTGMLSTLSSSGASKGFPFGSIVQYAPDQQGRPLLVISTLSSHTRHLAAESRCSFTVLRPGWQGLDDARVTLTGHMTAVPEAEQAAAVDAYLQANADSFWAKFGDFSPWVMQDMVAVSYVGGFGRAAQFKPEELASTVPDPIAPFGERVASHMNEDHAEANQSIACRHGGLQVDAARIIAIDSLGMDLQCQRKRSSLRMRVAWPRPLQSRQELREVIIEMSKAREAQEGVTERSRQA